MTFSSIRSVLKNHRIELSSNNILLLSILYLSTINNQVFWLSVLKVVDINTPIKFVFLLALLGFIYSFILVFTTLFSSEKLIKYLFSFLFLLSATCGYYMQAFGTIFDTTMLQNILQTDAQESLELLDRYLFLHIFIYGLIPVFILQSLKIKKQKLSRVIKLRAINLLIILSISAISVFSSYKELTFVFREHKPISYLINPIYPLLSVASYLREKNTEKKSFTHTYKDAYSITKTSSPTKNVFVMVVGETARAQNFSLNHYSRETNPELKKQKIINFSKVLPCGTTTAISVPCMFSNMTHEHFDSSLANNSENVLDGLKHAKINVLWLDNNSGCKGVCSRIENKMLSHLKIKDICLKGQCFDEILIKKLKQRLENINSDTLIVLHQQGSHGPAYYKRYPRNFAKFRPECRTSAVQNCSREEIVNSYDNTILYTDHVIAGLIDVLKNSKNNIISGLLYASDHGESLGENGIYLHGLPYFMAPKEQTRVPMILWLSNDFITKKNLNMNCLKKLAKKTQSHDIISHSLMGAMQVRSAVYDENLDIFSQCTVKTPVK